MSTRAESVRRAPLSRQRVLDAAVELADRGGIEALTMRKLAQELGVEAMSLYHHVASKDEVLDGITELVVAEINAAVEDLRAPTEPAAWKSVLRARILRAREVLLRHPWAAAVIESRATMSPAVLAYFDALAGVLRAGGFSVDLVHHAMHALGSRALGFSQELFDSDSGGDVPEGELAAMFEEMAGHYPHIAEIAVLGSLHDDDTTIGWCDDQVEFEFGLDLILDGLERLREREGP